MTVSTYKCIKCSTVFDSDDKNVAVCKACGSTLVKWVRPVVTPKPVKKEQEPNVNRGTRKFN
jgi:DNA-directed RNA polymerase subunit RPC12/RpoP